MPVRIKFEGTDRFEQLARDCRAVDDGGAITREMIKRMRGPAGIVRDAAQANVRGLPVRGVRGSGKHTRADFAASKTKRRLDERARQRIADRSGLRESTARATRMEITATARAARIRIKVNKNMMPPDQRKLPAHLNTGHWRHPVWGNRDRWAGQTAPPAWFDDAGDRYGPPARDAAGEVMDYIERKLADG